MRWNTAVAALVCGLLLTLATAPAEARRTVPRGWLGVVADPSLTQSPQLVRSQFPRMRKAGAETVRATFYWSSAQPTRNGPIDYTQTDEVVAAAARQHMRMLATVMWAPQWAAANSPTTDAPVLVPRHAADFARYMAALVRRYGTHGSFWRTHKGVPRQPVTLWQVWNEPSLPYFWNAPGAHRHQGTTCGRQPWVKSFMPLLRASSKAIRGADRKAKVVLPGNPNWSWNYLCALYRHGAKRYFDEVAIHPYALYVENHCNKRHTACYDGLLEVVRRIRKVMKAHRDTRKPVLLTEVSWPASKGRIPYDPGFALTPRGQVARIKQALPALAKVRRRYNIGGVWWYTWLSDYDAKFDQPFRFSGLRRLTPAGAIVNRPGLAAFARTARRLEGR